MIFKAQVNSLLKILWVELKLQLLIYHQVHDTYLYN